MHRLLIGALLQLETIAKLLPLRERAEKDGLMDADQDEDVETLYGLYRAELRRLLQARVGDPAEAEDLLQELWLRARQRPAGPVGNGRAYLFRMAQNLVVDRLRERQRRMARERRWSDQETDFTPAGIEPTDRRETPEDQIIAREEVAALASAIANLPDGARRAFELHKIKGLSHAEVADRLGISKSGVEKHMAIAMKYLRRALLR
ncbi:DNA-directed RNA polymerase sigma-70 factor [Sphingobium sp. TomTYG75]